MWEYEGAGLVNTNLYNVKEVRNIFHVECL